MIKEEIAPGIVVYSNVVSGWETLASDIEEGMASIGMPWHEAPVKESEDVKVNTLTRNTSAIGIPYSPETQELSFVSGNKLFEGSLSNLFLEHFSPVEQDYLNSYGIRSVWHEVYSVLKYGEGQFFTNHIDDHPDYHRRVSTVYYLNDNYVGGEISFPRFNINFKPKANQMIVFPSTYVYNHSVSPVLEGTRYAVVSWLR